MLISAVLICLTAVLVYLTYNTDKVLENDAYVINTAGIVRGSIQRLTKLELEGCGQVCGEIANTVDQHIQDIIESGASDTRNYTDDVFIARMVKLKGVWRELQFLFQEYRSDQSPTLKNEILRLSEYSWELADSAVLLAQIATETKMKNLKLFYPVAILIVIINLLTIILAYADVRKKLEYRATVDSLTDVYNRYAFRKFLQDELLRAERFDHHFALIYIDIDHFKSVNDTFGHQIGDHVLRELAKLVKSSVRKLDTIARVGGEEFAIIAPETSREDAIVLAEKLRTKIETHHFPTVDSITVSLGVTTFRKGCSVEEMVEQADKALYRAKEKGRNNVVYYPHLVSIS